MINDNTKPLIFIGSNWDLWLLIEACEMHNITIHGIIDSDYYGNTADFDGIPFIDTEASFDDPEKLEYYKQNFNFFLATNWLPRGYDPSTFNSLDASVTNRNKEKRHKLIDIIEKYDLPCINFVDPTARIHKTAILGKNIFVDALCYLAPKSVIGDFTNLFCGAGIGINTKVGKSCVFQRHSGTMNHLTIGDEVFFGLHAQAPKDGAQIRNGTTIHPCLMVLRDTQENEEVSLVGKDLRRVYHLHQEA